MIETLLYAYAALCVAPLVIIPAALMAYAAFLAVALSICWVCQKADHYLGKWMSAIGIE